MKLLAIVLAVVAALPPVGTKFKPLPPGRGKAQVESSCYPCHSADLLVQQRLTEKQWIATVDKMIRWGAVVKEEDKARMISYLVKNFGPANRFVPTKVQPARIIRVGK